MQVSAWLHVNLALVSEFNDNDVCKPFIKNLTLTLYKTVLFIQGDDYLSDCFYFVAVCWSCGRLVRQVGGLQVKVIQGIMCLSPRQLCQSKKTCLHEFLSCYVCKQNFLEMQTLSRLSVNLNVSTTKKGPPYKSHN